MRLPVLAALAVVLLVSGCAETQLVSHFAKKWTAADKSAGNYKIGKPYKIGSVWYYPQEEFRMVETGIASWYGPDFHGKYTANGEVYDKEELTAAHRTLQMPSMVRVTNLENGRSIVVRINDRGPFARGRIIDMSRRGAELLGFIGKGTARVRLEVLERESRQIAEVAKRGQDTSRLTLNDLKAMNEAPPTLAAGPVTRRPRQMASLDDDSLPESLQTPTITVDELNSNARPAETWPAPAAQPPKPAPVAAAPTAQVGSTPGQVKDGRFLPAPVVSYTPVKPTGIYVQAGSFTVQDNADKLRMRLASLGPVEVAPIMVKDRQFYRVRVGPLSSVSEADRVLERVIAVVGNTAKVIK